jgi:hypothetical protein
MIGDGRTETEEALARNHVHSKADLQEDGTSRPRRKLRLVFWLAMWKLRRGLVGRFRAFGTSMEPVIPSGSLVTIEPFDVDKIELGDIVVAQVGDSTMLHLVKSIDVARWQVEISGTNGPANGWTTLDLVYGICTRIGATPVPGVEARTKWPGLRRYFAER